MSYILFSVKIKSQKTFSYLFQNMVWLKMFCLKLFFNMVSSFPFPSTRDFLLHQWCFLFTKWCLLETFWLPLIKWKAKVSCASVHRPSGIRSSPCIGHRASELHRASGIEHPKLKERASCIDHRASDLLRASGIDPKMEPRSNFWTSAYHTLEKCLIQARLGISTSPSFS